MIDVRTITRIGLSVFACSAPVFAYAATNIGNFVPLSPSLPIIGNNWAAQGVPNLLNAFLGIAVALAAVLAVVMLAIGGFKYMTTDSVFQMGNAKEQIANAIIGLLIVLASILLLKTINPQLVSLNLFSSTGSGTGSPTTPTTQYGFSVTWNDGSVHPASGFTSLQACLDAYDQATFNAPGIQSTTECVAQ